MKKLLTFCLLMSLYFLSFGVYLENVPTQLVQPNGEVLNLFITGDEFFRRVHDSEGYSIVPGADGWYYYAVYDAERDELVPSEYAVTTTRNFELPMAKGLGISYEKYIEKRRAYYEPTGCDLSGASKNSILKDLANNGVKTTQQMNNIIICIGFSDTQGMTNNYSYVNGMFNTNTGDNMRDFFMTMSYNQLDLVSHFYPPANGNILRFYKDSHPRGYYQPYSYSNPIGYDPDDDWEIAEREHSLLANAVNWVNTNYPIPSNINLDINNDGVCDFITFVVYGNVGEWMDLLWPHKWSLWYYDVFINGKQIWEYNFELDGSSTYFRNNVFCHEGFHVLGAPDLYHYYNYTNLQTVGSWDLMENSHLTKPQSMSAYMKYKYGNWISSPPTATINQTYEVFPFYTNDGTDLTKPITYRIPMTGTSSQYSVVEYRKKTGTTYDAYIPNEGLLIYRINANMSGNAGFDGYSTFDEVYLYRPGSSQNSGSGVYTNGNLDQASYPSNGRTSFNSSTDPKPCQSNGTAENTLNINNILYDNVTDSYTFFYGNQSNRNISVNTTTLTLNAPVNSTGTVTITSNVLWRITIPSNATSWLSVSKTKGLNTGTVTFTTLSNNAGAPRSADVTITGNGQTFHVTVTQIGQTGDYVTVDLSASPASGGTVTGGGFYTIGQSVTITATPKSNYEFVNWTYVGGGEFATQATHTFNAPSQNIALVANFILTGQSVFFEDNFDEYTANQPLIGQGKPPWRTWSSPTSAAENPMVTSAHSSTIPNSVLMQNSNDILFPFNNLTTGKYTIEFDYYIPSTGNGGYFNLQHYNTPGEQWAIEVYFYNNATGKLVAGGSTINFSCKANQWFHILIDIDLDADLAYLEIDGNAVHSWPFHYQSNSQTGMNQLGGVNFFAGSPVPNPSNPDETLPGTYYLDNFKVTENEGTPDECNPATITSVVKEGTSNRVNWTMPGSQGDVTISQGGNYDNGAIGAGTSSFSVMHRFTPAQLVSVNGKELKQVVFVPGYGNNQTGPSHNYVIKIYQGGSAYPYYYPGTLIASQALNNANLNFNQENTITLTNPVTINASQELWIGYECINFGTSDNQYPAGHDAGPRYEGFGNLIHFSEDDDDEWYTLYEIAPTLNYNWCIKGIFQTTSGETVNIYFNGNPIASNVAGNNYLHTNPTGTNQCYKVAVNCTGGETSPMSNEVCAPVINTYTVIVSANPTNGGTVSGGGTYNQGANVTVKATANTGYNFVNWTKGGAQVSTNSSYSFPASENATYVANFTIKTYTVSLSANPTAGGSVTGGGTYNHGVNVNVTATANANYTFVNWMKGSTIVSTNATYSFPANENVTLNANFKYESGINENEQLAKFQLYPNPANDLLNIVRPTAEHAQIEIFNSLGLLFKSFEMNETETAIDVSTLASGVYFIKLTDNQSFSVQRFIKE